MEIGSEWVEWRGEDVHIGGAGAQRQTVVLCVISFFKHIQEPIYTIIPRALCYSGSWEYYVGASNRTNYLNNEIVNQENEHLYDKTRGDKIYYCRPSLPGGEPIDLKTLISRFKWGYAPAK